jgi:hypothetical protein
MTASFASPTCNMMMMSQGQLTYMWPHLFLAKSNMHSVSDKSMHGSPSMHPTLITATDEQLQPL